MVPDDPNVPYEMLSVIKKIVDDSTGERRGEKRSEERMGKERKRGKRKEERRKKMERGKIGEIL